MGIFQQTDLKSLRGGNSTAVMLVNAASILVKEGVFPGPAVNTLQIVSPKLISVSHSG